MYKTRLQELCQKRQWASPKYTCMKCGPDHEARFGASVSVNGSSFDSVVTFNSLKQALNYVARLALLHFTSPSDNDSRHKIQLLKYTKQRNLDLPSYSSESNGPGDSLFKGKVRVSEQVFESPGSFDTSKEAENVAAKTALASLLVENFHKDELRAYKSLLQELTQGEGFCAPVYRTTSFGVSHNPVFSSVVDLEGEIFPGKLAKSKKLAEFEASRVAYLALIQRGASRSTSKSTLRNIKHECKQCNDCKSGKLSSCSGETSDSPVASLAKLDLPSFSTPNLNVTTNSTTRASTTYLLCNKVRVYTEFPSHAFPEGIVVLPVGEDKWVAVSLEFTNEETN